MAAITIFNRAKIFQPFDALPGLREALAQKEWEHEYLRNINGSYTLTSPPTFLDRIHGSFPRLLQAKPFPTDGTHLL